MDEFALFIFNPLPGAKAAELMDFPGGDYISPLPKWRDDFKLMMRWRYRIIFSFLLVKLRYYPRKIFINVLNTLMGKAQIKGEMVIRRAFKLRFLSLFSRLGGKPSS